MYSGLWMFAWDLADEGVDHVMAWAADSGLTALQIAGSYHAGWFIHPHNPRHRAYMPEDGCVYFHPNAELYQDTILKPKVAAVCERTDWMREAGERLDRYGLKMVSWTVCMHNTRLGLLHPECTVTNCFGDSYPHALCPANPHVRNYIMALCRDLANNLPLYAVQLESPGYMGWAHGHHHERDLTVLTPLEHELMNLCFCDACVAGAQSKNIDVARVRALVRAILEAGMASAPQRPDGYPAKLTEIDAVLPALLHYRDFRQGVEDTLLGDIKAAMRPSTALLTHFGGVNPRIAPAIDVFNHQVYGRKPEEVLASTQKAKQALSPEHQLHVGIRLGLNSVADAQELTSLVSAVRAGGGDGVMFYNYSESPQTTLHWIKPALAANRQ
jgi:hypothetical protein